MLTTKFLRVMLAAVALVVVGAARPAQASPLQWAVVSVRALSVVPVP